VKDEDANSTILDQLREMVRQRRTARGISQKKAAARIGHTQKWLPNFESQKSILQLRYVFAELKLVSLKLQTARAVAMAHPELIRLSNGDAFLILFSSPLTCSIGGA
jgi:transcriptional regulator with XRE-family HTH domain